MAENIEQNQLRSEDGSLLSDFVRSVEDGLELQDRDRVREAVLELHNSDLADLMELLRPEDRTLLTRYIGDDLDFSMLTELDEPVRDQLVEELPNAQLAQAVVELDSDDAVYLLEDLEVGDQTDILSQIPEIDRATLQRSLDYPEDSAGRMMQADVIAVPPFWSVGQTIDYMRETENLPQNFSELYVVDPSFHPLGFVPLSHLLRTKRPVPINDITDSDLRLISVMEDQEEVARIFERYNLLSAPIVDDNNRLVGVVTVDDIVEVIQEEAEEDIHRLGGVGDESITDTVLSTTRSRFTWLFVNLLTAILASLVISLFDATIDQMVALAILMPIVASMGGNAGTQTMTVAVRALATRDLGTVNALRVIGREFVVGVLNGLLFAVILGGVTVFWFGSDQLGLVIACAMIFNMVVAGLSGILVPLGLDQMKIDPAVASSVFVTTVTDVVGFFVFLSLAAYWMF